MAGLMKQRTIDQVVGDLGHTRHKLIEMELEQFCLNRNLSPEELARDYVLVEQGEPLVFEDGTVRLNKNWRIMRRDEVDELERTPGGDT